MKRGMIKYLLLSLGPGAGMVLLGIGLPGLFETLNISPRWVVGAGIVLFIGLPIIFILLPKPKRRKSNITLNDKKTIQSIIDDTYSLYNGTGLFVKYCYLENRGTRLMDLNNDFSRYLESIKGRLVLVPQEMELKILRFFDILFEYKRSSEIIASATKTDNRYKDQQKLEKEFVNKVSPLYSEIEVELRKILNNTT